MEELKFLPSRDYGHGHAMAKSLKFPSRDVKNKGIEVTRWYETGLIPSREYCPYHAMAKIEVSPIPCATYRGYVGHAMD